MIIIGITGTLGAGKGTIVEHLVAEKKFEHYSVRAYITNEIIKSGLIVNRDNMVKIANELRAKHSPSYIVEQLFAEARQSGKNCVIESIRTPGEIEALKKEGNFYLFAVDAPSEVRYNHIVQRASETDKVDYKTFLENEKREMSSTDPNKQNISFCIGKADYIFDNHGTIEELHEKVDAVISYILEQENQN